MALTFEPFRVWFVKHHRTGRKMDFQHDTGLAPRTAAKVWNDRLPVSSDVVDRICSAYNLRVDQVIEHRPD
jgi:hypothetical protein